MSVRIKQLQVLEERTWNNLKKNIDSSDVDIQF